MGASSSRHCRRWLAEHAGFERASILFGAPDGSGLDRAYRWPGAGHSVSQRREAALLDLGMRWGLPAYEHQGCIHVPSVTALPPGRERAMLKERDTRSWLCVPLSRAGQAVGVLALEAVRAERRWQ